jgi:hypothetical protein
MDPRNALLTSRNAPFVRTASGSGSGEAPPVDRDAPRADVGLFSGLAIIAISGLLLTAASGALLAFGGPRY